MAARGDRGRGGRSAHRAAQRHSWLRCGAPSEIADERPTSTTRSWSGARCAGSPTAMLLARKGYNVLVVDRATFPSDTISTHLVHPPGVAALRRWGLLDRLVATGCPPIDTYAFDFGPFTIAGAPGTAEAPGRVRPAPDRARQAARRRRGRGRRRGPRGVHRRGDRRSRTARVTGIRGHGKGGETVTEHARVVIGADGRHSLVARGRRARAVQREAAAAVRLLHATGAGCRWTAASRSTSGPNRGMRGVAHPRRPDARRSRGWPFAEFEANKDDVEGNYLDDVRAGAGVRRAGPRRQARGALRRHGRAELLPQALRPRLGAGRRRRLQQGLHHRPGDHRRLPRRRAVRDRAGRGVLRRARRSTTRWASTSRRATQHVAADVRVHVPARDARAAAARDAAAARRRCTATRRRWTASPGSTPG